VSGLLADQITILAQVINEPAVLCASRLGIEVDRVDQMLSGLTQFLIQHHQRLATRSFSVQIDTANVGSVDLQIQHILTATASGQPIICVDEHCHYLRCEAGSVTVSAACKRTANGVLEAVVLGTYVQLIANGSPEAEYDFVQPGKGPPLGQKTLRPIDDFQGLLDDHIELDVRREKSFRYWADRSKRELLSKPDKTEKIFQRALVNWLDQHVIGRIRVVAETRGFGQDPADVLVVTDRGDHIIEVKWLGKNDAGTSWNRDRIDEGLVQVGEYLENDGVLVCGHLVVYDARKRDQHENDSTWGPNFKHEMCSDPRIIFLDSESVSQRAAATVRKKTGKKTKSN
jgi:hypothetical protein